jgi:hypothetical protein
MKNTPEEQPDPLQEGGKDDYGEPLDEIDD